MCVYMYMYKRCQLSGVAVAAPGKKLAECSNNLANISCFHVEGHTQAYMCSVRQRWFRTCTSVCHVALMVHEPAGGLSLSLQLIHRQALGVISKVPVFCCSSLSACPAWWSGQHLPQWSHLPDIKVRLQQSFQSCRGAWYWLCCCSRLLTGACNGWDIDSLVPHNAGQQGGSATHRTALTAGHSADRSAGHSLRSSQ